MPTGSRYKDYQLLAGKTTVCGVVLDYWSQPYIVKHVLKRPCTRCGLASPKKDNKMKVDFSAVADSFEPRKAGEVQGTLIKHEINPASASSGQPTLRLEWSEDESPNRRIFRTYSLQPKALWSVKRDLIRMGADVAEMNSPAADLDAICESLYGTSSTLVFGDPRPGKDTKTGEDRLYDNFVEVKKPE